MMAIASFLTIWLAQILLCLFFALRPWAAEKTKLPTLGQGEPTDETAGLPLAVLCGMILTVLSTGCLGRLRLGIWLILLAAAGAAVWTGVALYCQGASARKRLCRCITPAWVLAFGGSLLLALFFAWQQPMPTQWDEFSFWATAAKVVKNNDALYTLVEQTNLEARSYPAALAVLGYLFQWCAPKFTPWLLYAAYGTVYFAVFGGMLGLLGRKNLRGAAFAALVCVLCPIVVESWYPHQTLVAYATAYSDLMLGLLTAGGCALWFVASRGQGDLPCTGRHYGSALVQTALVILVLGLTKDVGLPLGLVVMLVCVLDQFACDFLPNKKDRRAWLRLAGVFLVLTAAAGLSFVMWSKHLSAAMSIDRAETGGSAQMSPVQMVICGVQELLGIGRSEKFSAVLSAMTGAFFRTRVSVLGAGLFTVVGIYLIFALAFFLGKPERRRILCCGIGSGLGFVGYYFFQMICYVYVFSDWDGRQLASYERYMSSYYLFWLLAALCVLFGAVRAKHRLAGMGLMAVSLTVLLLCGYRVDVQDTFLGRNAASWYTEQLIQERADQAEAVYQPGDKVLLISQWDDSARWYRYAYALDPVPLYHLRGENTIVPGGDAAEYPLNITAETIEAFLQKEGCSLVLLDVIDYDFWAEFRLLFTDGMQGFLEENQVVYRVEATPEGVRFIPAKEAAA